MTRRAFRGLAAVALALLSPDVGAAGPGEAEIVYLAGKGERRQSETEAWAAATVKEHVGPGGFVRTLESSQMGLLFADRTQMRLNQNSQLQIKFAAEAKEFSQTTVRLNAGRAWSQARPQAAPSAPPEAPRVSIETPSATMSIRGTDWEVEVLPDGSTQLVVLSGTVQMANDHGALTVGAGEAARAARDEAPAKLQLLNPRSRVQWVSAWKPQPRRWVEAPAHADAVALIERGEFEGALALLTPRTAADPRAAMLAADVRMSEGQLDDAIVALAPHAREPRAAALLARVLARVDRTQEARQRLEPAMASDRPDREVLLAAGELALLDGDVQGARRAFGRILEMQGEDPHALYGLGLVESERENVRRATGYLDRALAAAPRFSAAQAERAAVDTFAGNLPEARRRLEELLSREPDNYIALTVLGIELLKSGQAREALEAFLKSGTIEPRYARAWLYSGAAFYQLGDDSRALEAFRKAAALDPRDPAPHIFESLVLGDRLDYGAAIEAARRAEERMPYLKSLNQIANDQRGSANAGAALANFGLEEWASWYAREAYSPFWAGSHFFLADRYTGAFTKNSELFQGYLTDPTAFGASNRRSTLVPTPGHYGKVEAFYERADWRQGSLIGTVNGLVVDPVPLAYFASGDFSRTSASDDPSSGNGRNLILGLGMRPRHDIGLFAFATDLQLDADLQKPTLSDDRLTLSDRRVDVGMNVKLAARNQLWLKVGSGSQSSDVSGAFVSASTAASLNQIFATTIFGPNGRLDGYHASANADDVQFRHAFGDDSYTLNWGVERGRLDRPGELVTTFAPVRLRFSETQNLRSTDVYVSGTYRKPGTVSLQADLWHQSADIERLDVSTMQIGNGAPLPLQNIARNSNESEFNPRAGIAWTVSPVGTVRMVGQKWRRSASVATLGPVDTEGIVVNDRLPVPGGLYKRARLQFDHGSSGSFIQGFLDRELVDNGIGGIPSVVPSIDLTQLEALRNRRDVFTAVPDIEQTPQFAEGSVGTLGLAGNMLVSQQHSVALRYLYRKAEQSGANAGLAIPYLPRHMLRAASQWTVPSQRLLFGASATYRSARYRDDVNQERINQGWTFGAMAYWETTDKRVSVQGVLDNLLSDKAAGIESHVKFTARLAYKF